MISVRLRITFLIALSLAVVLGSGHLTAESYTQLKLLRLNIIDSFHLSETAREIYDGKYKQSDVAKFKSIGLNLIPSQRREAWQQLVGEILERNTTRIKSRARFVESTEKEYRRVQENLMPFFENRLLYFSFILLSSVLISFFAIIFYLKASVFNPIKALSRKMSDFLQDRYTYQFSVPAPTEVGHLQATFNALAQRVLSNMEELTNLDHAKSEFLSIASHELRTPLTSIKGSLSLMKSGVVGDMNEMAQNLLNIAESETDRLIRLINELLDLAKIEAGKFEVRSSWSPLQDLVNKTFAGLNGLAQSAQVELTAGDIPSVQVMMDKDRIQQVLTNLISNAIKFSPKGSAVEVTIDADLESGLTVNVTDHGRGIAPADQELIFQKFRQATSPKNPLVKGTGLGLSIAKALVEEHGGRIGVRSVPNEGSTFYFTLPQWQFVLPIEEVSETQFGVAA